MVPQRPFTKTLCFQILKSATKCRVSAKKVPSRRQVVVYPGSIYTMEGTSGLHGPKLQPTDVQDVGTFFTSVVGLRVREREFFGLF